MTMKLLNNIDLGLMYLLTIFTSFCWHIWRLGLAKIKYMQIFSNYHFGSTVTGIVMGSE